MFYEYFHGDTGAGIGASHQTGWSGAVARIMHLFVDIDAQKVLEKAKDDRWTEPATGEAVMTQFFIRPSTRSTPASG